MVTTRSSKSSAKHEAPKGTKNAPSKKQKTTKSTKKDPDVETGKSREEPDKGITSKVEDKQQEDTMKPPAEEPAAAEAEKRTTGGADRESKESRYESQEPIRKHC